MAFVVVIGVDCISDEKLLKESFIPEIKKLTSLNSSLSQTKSDNPTYGIVIYGNSLLSYGSLAIKVKVTSKVELFFKTLNSLPSDGKDHVSKQPVAMGIHAALEMLDDIQGKSPNEATSHIILIANSSPSNQEYFMESYSLSQITMKEFANRGANISLITHKTIRSLEDFVLQVNKNSMQDVSTDTCTVKLFGFNKSLDSIKQEKRLASPLRSEQSTLIKKAKIESIETIEISNSPLLLDSPFVEEVEIVTTKPPLQIQNTTNAQPLKATQSVARPPPPGMLLTTQGLNPARPNPVSTFTAPNPMNVMPNPDVNTVWTGQFLINNSLFTISAKKLLMGANPDYKDITWPVRFGGPRTLIYLKDVLSAKLRDFPMLELTVPQHSTNITSDIAGYNFLRTYVSKENGKASPAFVFIVPPGNAVNLKALFVFGIVGKVLAIPFAHQPVEPFLASIAANNNTTSALPNAAIPNPNPQLSLGGIGGGVLPAGLAMPNLLGNSLALGGINSAAALASSLQQHQPIMRPAPTAEQHNQVLQMLLQQKILNQLNNSGNNNNNK